MGRTRLVQRLKPLDNGVVEIRALDGLRAVAALSIVAYHALRTIDFQHSALNQQTGNLYFYLSTGVQLFFVLSGFLLFLPYARVMLQGQPLPSARRFYQRRALRILPAYWVALVVLALLPTSEHTAPLGIGTLVTHVLMIHDMFPVFNRDLEGPFWTLAVEVQFYVLLPLLAVMLAKIVGSSRSHARLLCGLLTLLALALGLRALDMALADQLPPSGAGGFLTSFMYATMGTQGKFLEVFILGMLCSAIYVMSVEMSAFSLRQQRRCAWLLLLLALAVIIALALPHGSPGGASAALVRFGDFINPLLVGLGYSILLLAILWGGTAIRGVFELAPLRFIGLISYSLYLWHLPVLHAMIPAFVEAPMTLRIAGAFVFAYLSYQLVERPFLNHRHRNARQSMATSIRSSAGITGTEIAGWNLDVQSGIAGPTWAAR
jgi:peptidoglycan/LPS O-acetylase OafA/YrhL